MSARIVGIPLLCLVLAACSSPRKSRIALTSGATVAGLAIGAGIAPADERRELHALYWAGLLGVGAAVAGEFFFSDESEMERIRLENDKLKAEMELMKNANTVLLKQGQGYFKGAAGEEYFQSGKAKWRLYQIDRWQREGPNRLYHQDRMVELLPEDGKNP